MTPEISAENGFVIESITYKSFNLLFDGAIKIFKRFSDDPFFLVFERVLNSLFEFGNFCS